MVDTQSNPLDRLDVGSSGVTDPILGSVSVLHVFGPGPYPAGLPTWGTVVAVNPDFQVNSVEQITVPPIRLAGFVWQVTVTLQAFPDFTVATLADAHSVAFQVASDAFFVDNMLNAPHGGSSPTDFLPSVCGNFVSSNGTLPSGDQLSYPDGTTPGGPQYESVVSQVLMFPNDPTLSLALSIRVYSNTRTFYALSNAQGVYDDNATDVKIAIQIRAVRAF